MHTMSWHVIYCCNDWWQNMLAANLPTCYDLLENVHVDTNTVWQHSDVSLL